MPFIPGVAVCLSVDQQTRRPGSGTSELPPQSLLFLAPLVHTVHLQLIVDSFYLHGY